MHFKSILLFILRVSEIKNKMNLLQQVAIKLLVEVRKMHSFEMKTKLFQHISTLNDCHIILKEFFF